MDNSSAATVLSRVPSWEWTAKCIKNLVAANDSVQFVGAGGRPMSSYMDGPTWGIDRGTCIRHCNSTVIPLNFQFQAFAAAFTNYLLPWLGLIAQLPTETGHKPDGFISLCLAVGSPALITYSLMLTIRNRYWVRQEFRDLRRHIGEVHARYPEFDQRLTAIQYVLEEAQQVPLRVSQEQGWFSSLIVAPQNDGWWKLLREKLKDTRRGVTLSLMTQMAVATIAWLFTVIAAFVSSLGDTVTALQISAGSIWIWMIPVIWGWVRVGTQQLPRSIDSALEIENAALALPEPNEVHYTQSRNQRGLVVAEKNESGLTPFTMRMSTLNPGDSYRINSFANMRGDEKRRGPVFNYARIFTYCHLVGTVHGSLKVMMDNIRKHQPCSGNENEWRQGQDFNTELRGNASRTDSYCGLDRREVFAYPEWHQIPGSMWSGIALSATVAMLLQWGTTGAAIMIAYLTPTEGLGCRSGGYLLYGVNATLSWISLTVSSFLSHSAMLRFQRDKQKPDTNAATSPLNGTANGNATVGIPLTSVARHASNTTFGSTPGPYPTQSRTAWDFVPFRALAAITRYFGKALAVANTFFLIAISVFEFTGGFDNCWCESDAIGLGSHGWVVLFKTASDLKQAASLPWGAGIATSVIMCLLSYAVFWVGM